jgi:GDP-L-fucose synthase
MADRETRRVPRSAARSRQPIYALTGKRVWVAGHRGMVGSALVRRLRREPCELITVTRDKLDLRRQADVERWLDRARPEVIIIAAATVGGIHANRSRPTEFIYDNLAISLNIVRAAHGCGVEKLLFLGSSCIYPKLCPQPMTEDYLLSGPLEPTNQWYAIAKLAGLMLAQAYRAQHGMDCIAALPTNIYGPGDNFDLEQGHVISALLRKLHEATRSGDRIVEIWGTGLPRREFMHVDDLADALVYILGHYSDGAPINIGSGDEVSIAELADLAARVVGYRGRFVYNTTQPDGAPRKRLDISHLTDLGWQRRISLFDGLQDAYAAYVRQLTASSKVAPAA